ncbi:hypothetical protein M3Y97_00031300 [Aphelenchoides bicaudatus]|nr:hypothetical protein M3Y97_00031300 [Aphelenchoides bicaudatus]
MKMSVVNQQSTSEKLDENEFDELPSLFPPKFSKDVKIFTIKSWKRAKLQVKKVARELRERSSVIVRGFDDQVDRCISCIEMAKNWLAEKPIVNGNDCSTVYQWNKIGQIKIKAENSIDLDQYVPILEILLSRVPLKDADDVDSIQESKAIEISSSEFRREDTGYEFGKIGTKAN